MRFSLAVLKGKSMPISSPLLVEGFCDSRFEAVRDGLAQNLSDGNELGEAVSIVVEGRTVVDLWGGYKDQARKQPWERGTLVCMFSQGKTDRNSCRGRSWRIEA